MRCQLGMFQQQLSYRTRAENQRSSSRFTVHYSNVNNERRMSANARELGQAQGEQNTSTYRSHRDFIADFRLCPTSFIRFFLLFPSPFHAPAFLLTLARCPLCRPFIPPLCRRQSKRPNAESTGSRVYNPRRSFLQPQQNGPKSAGSDLLPNAYNAQTSPREINSAERRE